MDTLHISNKQAARKCYDAGLDLEKAVKFINENCKSSGYIDPKKVNDYIKKL